VAVDGNRITCDVCGVSLLVPTEALPAVDPSEDLDPLQRAAVERGWTNDWEGMEPGDRCFKCSPPPDRREIGPSTPEQTL
jgi:hypothetical protein